VAFAPEAAFTQEVAPAPEAPPVAAPAAPEPAFAPPLDLFDRAPASAPPAPLEDEPPAIEAAPAPARERPPPSPREAETPRLHPRVQAARQGARYEPALAALVRVLGASHALRIACQGKADQVFRGRMTALLDMEAPRGDETRRAALVEAFNAAFEDEAARSPRCDGSIRRKEADLAAQGRALARTLRELYAGTAMQQGARP
jgi:uncharacterized protein (TIGR02301 family)